MAKEAGHFLGRSIFSLSRGLNIVGVSTLMVMMVLTVADVSLRYLINQPIPGAFELTEFLLVILASFGLAARNGDRDGNLDGRGNERAEDRFLEDRSWRRARDGKLAPVRLEVGADQIPNRDRDEERHELGPPTIDEETFNRLHQHPPLLRFPDC